MTAPGACLATAPRAAPRPPGQRGAGRVVQWPQCHAVLVTAGEAARRSRERGRGHLVGQRGVAAGGAVDVAVEDGQRPVERVSEGRPPIGGPAGRSPGDMTAGHPRIVTDATRFSTARHPRRPKRASRRNRGGGQYTLTGVPIAIAPVDQIMSMAALVTREHPWDAGVAGMLPEPCTAMPPLKYFGR